MNSVSTIWWYLSLTHDKRNKLDIIDRKCCFQNLENKIF